MLSAKLIENAQQAEHYFGQDNYYTTEEGFEHSAWAGKGAAALGLTGGVHREQFMELLQGKVDGQELGKWVKNEETGEKEREHRPGIDLTFSAPKSVSLLAEVAGDERVSKAHEVAVSRAIAYLEREAAQARSTTGGITTRENTGNLVVAMFRHDTSRELDPQTHTHAVVLNVTRREDGQWRSVSNEELLGHIKSAGAYYRAELAAELSKLGYEIDRTHEDGRFEVKGFTPAQLDHFSQRSGQIEQALEARGKDRRTATTAEKQTAALDTRKAKREVDREPLREEWLSRAKDVGIDWDSIPRNKAPTFARESSAELYLRAKESVDYATKHLSERQAGFAIKDLYRTAVEHGIGKTTIEAIDKAIREAKKEGALIEVGDKRLTTREAVTAELRMVDTLQRSKGATAAVVNASVVESKIEAAEKRLIAAGTISHGLNAGQEDAAKLILGSGDRYVGVQGYAGTGKTTMLNVVKAVAEEQGYTVRGMAQSASAAETLQAETGMMAQTLESFLLERRREQAQAAKTQQQPASAAREDRSKPSSLDVMGNRYLEIPGGMFRERQLLVARGTVTNAMALAAVDKLRGMHPDGILAKAAHSHALETAKGIVTWERASTTDHVLYRAAEAASKIKGLFHEAVGREEAAKPKKELWVVDEASLIGQRDANRLMAEAEKAGAKVVMVGDTRQLSAVNAGKPFEVLQDRGMQTATMTEIHRQQTDQLKGAVADIIERREREAFGKLASNTVELKDNEKLIAKIVADVRHDAGREIRQELVGTSDQQRKDTLVITALNEDRRAINDGVRQALKEDGVITGAGRESEVLVNRGMTKAQASQATTYHEGDVVRFGRDYGRLGVRNGEYGRVVGIEGHGTVKLQKADGQIVDWRPEQTTKVEVFRAERRELQAGDKIRFTRNDKARGMNNGDVAYIKSIDGHTATAQIKGKTVALDLRETRHWDYAYASTIHSSQGKTVDATAFHIRGKSGQAFGDRAFYVGATRSRHELRIYTDDRDSALRAVARDQHKASALEELKRTRETGRGGYSHSLAR